MPLKIDARTSRKYKMVQEKLRIAGQFNPELRKNKSYENRRGEKTLNHKGKNID